MLCRVRLTAWCAAAVLGFQLGFQPGGVIAGQVNPVMPEQERSSDGADALGGPKESRGVSVRNQGANALGEDFAAMAGRALRVREITVEPDGVVAAHQHKQRPGVAYLVEGEILEFRNDAAAPILRKAGEVVLERSGVAHWWHNQSDKPVKAIVVDIVPDTELRSNSSAPVEK